MNREGQAILAALSQVAAERRQRLGDPALAAGVLAVKAYQHRRFELTYSDLLASPRFGRSASFFLEDLYGPHDFTQRDEQFARIVPGLVRLFPHEIVVTVKSLGELHALSEVLDTQMARQLPDATVDAQRYIAAWQAVGRPTDRARQIELMLAVGTALDRYTRNPLLRHTLRMMRGPARALGLGTLQAFLENGFDTFRDMNGAQAFLDTIAAREGALAAALFAAPAGSTALPGTSCRLP